MAELQHLSYSSISTYQLCPESWRRRYIEGQKELTSTALIFGSAFHGTVQTYLQVGGRLADIWSDKWGEQIARENDIAWEGDTPESLRENGWRMFDTPAVWSTIERIKTAYDPQREQSVERRVELHVPGVSVPIIGYIDVVLKDGTLADFKTAARMWPADSTDKPDKRMQPLVYLAGLNQAGINDHGWAFRYYVFIKSAKPTVKVFDMQLKPAEVLTGLFPQIRQVWTDIQAERFPKVTAGWKCSPKYCGYWNDCQGKGN